MRAKLVKESLGEYMDDGSGTHDMGGSAYKAYNWFKQNYPQVFTGKSLADVTPLSGNSEAMSFIYDGDDDPDNYLQIDYWSLIRDPKINKMIDILQDNQSAHILFSNNDPKYFEDGDSGEPEPIEINYIQYNPEWGYGILFLRDEEDPELTNDIDAEEIYFVKYR